MNTARSGLSAATTLVEVTANNLANWRTPGFHARRVQLATATPKVFSSAAAVPRQIGTGVYVAGINEQQNDESNPAAVDGSPTAPSNVDIGRELIELTLAGNMFRGNLAVLQTANTLLGELFFPWRR